MWVTNLRNRYSSDIFFRTEFNVIALQICFAVVLSVLIASSFNYLYKDILQTLLTGIQTNLANHGSFTSSDIVASIRLVRAKNFFTFFTFAVSITIIFSYIIARMTLSPTRQALKSQKRFVSDIAHELRTPLAIIKTNSEVALMDDMDLKTKKIFRSNISELDRVSGIINNLLTFNNLVHPEKIKFTQIHLGEVVEYSIKKLDDLIRSKDIKLSYKKTLPDTVFGNKIALEQIVINIIKNAINYNSQGGGVSVYIEPDYSGNILLIVKDNGMGIAQDDLVHIFEPFFRAERSRKRQTGSSGLGLTIVNELVKLHSGKISISSVIKKGTEVTIILPFSKETEVEKENVVKNHVSIDYHKSN